MVPHSRPKRLRHDLSPVHNHTISVSKQAAKDENNKLIVARPKTENSIRQISIPQEAVELLMKEHAKHPSNPWLFPSSRTGDMYHPDSVATLHQRILKDAGLEHLRFHDLRHTFATLALQNGVDIKTVSAMLGHYDAGFTLRTYTHATRQKQDEAAQTMGTSWRRSDKRAHKTKQRTGWEAELPCRCAAFFAWCGSWCGSRPNRLLKPRTFCIAKCPENDRFRGVSWS